MKLYNILLSTAAVLTIVAAGSSLPGWTKWLCVILTAVCLFVAVEMDYKRREAEAKAELRKAMKP